MAGTHTVAAYTIRDAAGAPVRWAAPSATLVVDPSLKKIEPSAADAVLAAIDAWSAVPDAYVPVFAVEEGDADEVGYHRDRANRSTIRFAAEGFEPAGHALAVTVLSYDESGRIVDADIVINGGPTRRFAQLPPGDPAELDETDGDHGDGDDGDYADHDGGRYDLQSILTHEFGHVLGLGEEPAVAEATMFPTTARGETKKRDLSGDDEVGLSLLYAEPFEESAGGTAGCSVAPAGGGVPWAPIFAMAGSGLWILRARRPQARGRHVQTERPQRMTRASSPLCVRKHVDARLRQM